MAEVLPRSSTGMRTVLQKRTSASDKQESLNSCPANHPLERELSDQHLLILERDFVSKKLCRLQQ